MNPWTYWESLAVQMAKAWLALAARNARQAEADRRALPR
jgi:hypothetical protein